MTIRHQGQQYRPRMAFLQKVSAVLCPGPWAVRGVPTLGSVRGDAGEARGVWPGVEGIPPVFSDRVYCNNNIICSGFQAAGWSRRISNVWAEFRRVQSFLCAQARLFRGCSTPFLPAAPSNSGDPRGHLHVNAPRVALLPSPGSLPSYPLPLPGISPVTNTMRSNYYPQFYR